MGLPGSKQRIFLRKLTGMAFRVPVPDSSVVDLTVRLGKPVSCLNIKCRVSVEVYTFMHVYSGTSK